MPCKKYDKTILYLDLKCSYLELFFNPESQLKNAESAIKNKLKDLFSEFRGFEFVTTLVAEFKK